MDFLNKAYAPFADLLKTMTPAARLMAALLVIVSVVSLGYLFNDRVAGPDTYLMGGEVFSVSQLNEMQAALGKAGLEATLDGARVKVPRGQESKYMAALAEAGALPPDFGSYLKKAVGSINYWTPRAQQEAAMKIAKQHELQNIINHMEGVKESAVQIDEEIKRGFQQQNIVTASVNIVPRDNQPLDENRIPAIRYLVASSVAGLKPDAVTVVDLSTGLPYPGNGGASNNGGGMMGDYAQLKRHYERDLQQKIKNLLAIPGVRVTASVELDNEILNEESSVHYDSNTVVYETRETSVNKVIDGAAVAGALARGILQPGTPTTLPKNNEDSSQTVERKALPTTQKRIVREGRMPKRVTASIAVPNSYYEKIWRQQNPAQAASADVSPNPSDLLLIETTEKRKIEESVAALLPKREAKSDSGPQIAVSTFYDFPIATPPEPTFEVQALAWLSQNWSAVGLGVLGFFSLLVLRSMVRSIARRPLPPPIEETPSRLSLLADGPVDDLLETSPRERLKRRADARAALRDDLTDIVREDPDGAASVLRSWIGAAS